MCHMEHCNVSATTELAMRLLSKKQVKDLVSLSYTQIARLESAGLFPKRMRLGNGPRSKVAWLEQEVLDWIMARLAKRDALTTPA